VPAIADPGDLGAAVRASRRARGWTQAELARRAGTTRQWVSGFENGHPRAELGIALRLLDAAHLSLATTPAPPGDLAPRRLTARSVARAIREELERDDEIFALRLLGRAIADFRDLEEPVALAAFLAPPPSTGDPRWDTLLAAALSRECRKRDMAIPEWTRVPPLSTFWFVDDDPILTARTMQRTPIDLRNKGIWLDGNALETA
jgi:HTH-type transcriptional regulator/antitoxin HipB